MFRMSHPMAGSLLEIFSFEIGGHESKVGGHRTQRVLRSRTDPGVFRTQRNRSAARLFNSSLDHNDHSGFKLPYPHLCVASQARLERKTGLMQILKTILARLQRLSFPKARGSGSEVRDNQEVRYPWRFQSFICLTSALHCA